MPCSAITAAVDSRATTITSWPARSSDGGQQAADAARAEHGDPHRAGLSEHRRGFITPAGSTAAFAPRSAAAKGSGRWRSYHGR